MSQTVTNQLRQWIVEQATHDVQPDAVLKAMLLSGWKEDVAIKAIEETMTEYVEKMQAGKPVDFMLSMPQLVPVPNPNLENDPLYIDLGDVKVSVLQTLAQPRVVLFGGLVTDEECELLIAAARPKINRSLTVDNETGTDQVHKDRTSNGMFFQRGENELVKRIEERIAHLVNWPIENGEGLQILQYEPGAEYKPHFDYFDPEAPGTATILKRGGQRVGTIVMYLSEPAQGGATVFPDVQLSIAPKRGNALFFSYNRAHPSTGTLHGGAPVISGEKWVATKWLREGPFV